MFLIFKDPKGKMCSDGLTGTMDSQSVFLLSLLLNSTKALKTHKSTPKV